MVGERLGLTVGWSPNFLRGRGLRAMNYKVHTRPRGDFVKDVNAGANAEPCEGRVAS